MPDRIIDVTVVQHFDDAVRHTTYDDFLATIRGGTDLTGLLMTPDAAFGYERGGTPEAVRDLGEREGFDLVVVDPLEIDGAAVRSSDIRRAIGSGDLSGAERLLGRPVTLQGQSHEGHLSFDWPMAMPPSGLYTVRVDGRPAIATVEDGDITLAEGAPDGVVRLEFLS